MNNNNIDKMKTIFNFAEKYLAEICPPNVDLNRYLQNPKTDYTMNEICERLIRTISNRNMMPGVIQLKERHDLIENILFNFDHDAILSAYDSQSLFEKFREKIQINNVNSPKNLWRQFASSIISACEFLKNFSSPEEFDDFVNLFSKNEITKAALPMVLDKEIDGIGFALACDFLKELGYTEYPKPDIHLREVFFGLGVCSKNQYDVYKAIIKMANVCNKTAYYVDKTIWLICSGKFYIEDINIPGRKSEFIKLCNENLDN
jgi:hypothetical protein